MYQCCCPHNGSLPQERRRWVNFQVCIEEVPADTQDSGEDQEDAVVEEPAMDSDSYSPPEKKAVADYSAPVSRLLVEEVPNWECRHIRHQW